MGDPVLAIAFASSIGAVVTFATIIIILGYSGVSTARSLGVVFVELTKALPFVAALLAIRLLLVDDLIVMLAFVVLGLLFTVLRFKHIVGMKLA